MARSPLTVAIHDLNTWGGQDRSTLEITKCLSHKWPVEILVYELHPGDNSNWGPYQLQTVWPDIRRPALLKYIYYYAFTSPKLFIRRHFKGHLVQATGVSALLADLVQVQFIHSTWLEKQKKFGLEDRSKRSLLSRLYHGFLTTFNCQMEKALFRHSKHYIAISHSIRDELISHFNIPKEKITVVHHGVDPKSFFPPQQDAKALSTRRDIHQRFQIKDEEILILLVGALNDRKGLGVLIEAISQLPPPLLKKCRLLAVGGGSPEPYQQLAQKLNISDRVDLLTLQKDIRPYYWASDLFALPSLYEPFGLVTLEAMACGLPSLVSQTAGSAELIEDQVSGVLIQDPTSAQEISQKLTFCLEDEKVIEQLSQQARKVAESHSWSKVAERYLQIIQHLAT